MENIKINNKLLTEKFVKIYYCGPTIYDELHIGNLRPIVVFNAVRNALIFTGHDVELITNITDVDDKIINKCIQENKSFEEVVEYYYQKYIELLNLAEININEFTIVRVTDNMDNIINYIDKLVKLDIAYEVNGSVYFNVEKIKEYGTLSNRTNQENNLVGKSKDEKINPNDFAIWKKTNDHVKNWKSSYSKGRPGWHTECACFIDEYLKGQATIHGGGIDLKFPHHENENAQNIALHNKSIAKFWMHTGMVNLKDEKMSKSKGNIVTAKALINEYGANVIKLFLLKNHYSKPVSLLEEELKNLKKIILNYKTIKTYYDVYLQSTDKLDIMFIDKVKKEIVNDFNFANIITLLIGYKKEINRNINEENINIKINTLVKVYQVLGIYYANNFSKKDILKIKDGNFINEEYNINKTRNGLIPIKKGE